VTSPENSGPPEVSPENSGPPEVSPENSPQPPQQESPSPEELKVTEARLHSIEQHNNSEIAALAKMGAELDVGALTLIRVNTFIEFVFERLGTSSPEVRRMLTLLFETEYQEAVSKAFNDVKAEVRKAMIGSAGGASAQQMQQMWQRQQNGHGETPPPPGFVR
jgi:hypothetical protein